MVPHHKRVSDEHVTDVLRHAQDLEYELNRRNVRRLCRVLLQVQAERQRLRERLARSGQQED